MENVALIEAARAGDTAAQDELVTACMPLVYNIVGRALNGHADVDDVVQETMLRVVNGLRELRDPASFRSWLVAITTNQIRGHWRAQRPETPVSELPETVAEVPDPAGDFVSLTIVRLGLQGQRREVVEATRWLDPGERETLSLWWLEAAGELTRAEVAAALELTPQHTAVRVQRTKAQLDTARGVVRALSVTPRCQELASLLAPWDGVPSALWRKRIARHARTCGQCGGAWSALVPAEGLLVGFGLVPVTAALLEWWRSGAVLHTQSMAAQSMAATQSMPVTQSIPGASSTPAGQSIPSASAAPSASSASHAKGRGRRRARPGNRKGALAAGTAVAVLAAVAGGVYLFNGSQDREVRGQSATDAGQVRALNDRTIPATSPSPSATVRPSASPSAKPKPSPSASRTAKPSATPTTEAPEPSATTERPAPKPVAPTVDDASGSLAEQVIALVNAERAKVGCSPVRNNSQLAAAAQRHSDDMAARNFFDHTNPDGQGPGERITAAGYQWSTYGENIAYGQQTPASVMDSWMHSSGHRANILNCSFKDLGVGVNQAPGGPRWTQDFGAK
ncbi:sigma-70 family RNA polymerase sigma factor [Streptomyces orinoci]|uniref:Sigma-70 family RNA polymerase sigma factor n=1 Tax=Streptomyces orinoci TaxID=67339 RepID=A0ABV3JQM9_STRON|nr:sigma-70 family RNA polymerase sigma factor [Streptomyces orinoci]